MMVILKSCSNRSERSNDIEGHISSAGTEESLTDREGYFRCYAGR